MPPKGIQYSIFEYGWLSFLVFISTLVLNGCKLGKNFSSVMIFGFMPSHRPILMSSCDLSLALTIELGLGIHSEVVVTVWSTEICSKRLHIDSY